VSDGRRSVPHVAIVGAGVAGTLTALQLTRAATRSGRPVDLTLIDRADGWAGSGGFGTVDPCHLLNVSARAMSAFPDAPDDFVAWRSAQGLGDDPHAFAPRREFARYVQQRFDGSRIRSHGLVGVRRLRAHITAVRRGPMPCAVTLCDAVGDETHYDAAVLALGLPAAGVGWAPPALRDSPRFIADPWRPAALDAVRRGAAGPSDVLVVGTGLTMVDIVLSLAGDGRTRLHAISRGGRLPEVHATVPSAAVVPDVADWGDSLARIADLATAHVGAVRLSTGDWRPGVDGLRHVMSTLWSRLSEADRATFLARDAAAWTAVRHRMAPSSDAALQALRRADRLRVSTGGVADASPLPAGGLRVHTTDGRRLDVGWVVNGTGPHPDVRTLGEPLLDDLLRHRSGGALAEPATAGLGLRTAAGRLETPAVGTPLPLWTLGALRRGELWESTAVPEIREQARAVAAAVFDDVQVAAGPRPLTATW
jgi:uncharacterized NAD(P)/FAD-binding protein YdhS